MYTICFPSTWFVLRVEFYECVATQALALSADVNHLAMTLIIKYFQRTSRDSKFHKLLLIPLKN